ncbi:MAG: twin-arginine translocation signal domain-containing protein [Planctomycetia bacterium]
MHSTRRGFLQSTALAGTAATGGLCSTAAADPAKKPDAPTAAREYELGR